MARVELDLSDAPGCPLIGLAADQGTRYTFPHPDHRCYSSGSATGIKPEKQATYCLCLDYVSCDRYGAWRHAVGTDNHLQQHHGPKESHIDRSVR